MLVSKPEYEHRLAAAFFDTIGQAVVLKRLPDGEGPDFAAQFEEGTVGLEITRIYRSDSEDGLAFREIEGRQYQVAVGADRIWQQRGGVALTVYIHFPVRGAPRKADIPKISVALVDLVATNVPAPGESITVENEWRTPNLVPDGVAAVTIYNLRRATTSHWFVPQSGMVPDLSPDVLQARIAEKSNKLAEYSAPPAQNWLLLVAEGTGPASTFTIVPAVLEHTYESAFEQTYLFEAFSRRVERLSTRRPGPLAA